MDILRFFKLMLMSIFIVILFAVLSAITSSCSKKTINIEEEKEFTYAKDSIDYSSSISSIKHDIDEWWNARITKTIYSSPDSQGNQYPTSVEVIDANGGKTIHDTITITTTDTVVVKIKEAGNTKYIYKEKKTNVSYSKIIIHSILTILIISLLFLLYKYKGKVTRLFSWLGF